MINPFKKDIAPQKKQRFFTSVDAWVFASLWSYDSELKDIDLWEIIARGDTLNHSVLQIEEIVEALKKLQEKGLLIIKHEKLAFTKTGLLIKDRILKRKGGLFSIVSNTESILNSTRTKFETVSSGEISSCEFLLSHEINYGIRK